MIWKAFCVSLFVLLARALRAGATELATGLGDATAGAAVSVDFSASELSSVVPLDSNLPAESAQRCFIASKYSKDPPVPCEFASFGTPPPPTGEHMELPLHFHRFNNKACNTLPAGDTYNGHALLAYRGRCPFYEKALKAQNAGAAALIIINTADSDVHVGASGDESGVVTIPVVVVHQSDGEQIKTAWRSALEQEQLPHIQLLHLMQNAEPDEHLGQLLKQKLAQQPESFEVSLGIICFEERTCSEQPSPFFVFFFTLFASLAFFLKSKCQRNFLSSFYEIPPLFFSRYGCVR